MVLAALHFTWTARPSLRSSWLQSARVLRHLVDSVPMEGKGRSGSKASYLLTAEDEPASSQRDHHKTGVNDERPTPPRRCLLQGEIACQFIQAERSEVTDVGQRGD